MDVIFGYLSLIFLALLPFFFFYKGYQGGRKQQKKYLQYFKASQEEYQKNTTCKHCGKRNYVINKYVTTSYQDTSTSAYESSFSEVENRRYTFVCRNCRNVISIANFSSENHRNSQMPSSEGPTSEKFGVDEAEVLAEMKMEAVSNRGCSYSLYYLAGIFFLVIDILMLLLSKWGVL